MAKRRFISQLPVIHQTTTLQKFFNATVDQVFQPGETQNVNAFIGRKPSYFDPKKDFYKSEINADRAFYQLEPAMTTKASDGTFEDLLFYPDLINQLRFQGADTSNHERLLETDFYSWCPPINIDKLTRYRDYYWLPDGPPVMLLDLGFRDDDGNGTNDNPFYARTVSDGFQTVYPLPTAIPGMVIDYAIHRNGVPVTNEGVVDGNDDQNGTLDGNNPNGPVVDGNQDNGYTIVGNSVIFSGAWPAGDVIELWINANYKQNIIGKESYTHPVQVYGYIETQVETSNGIKTVTYGPSLVENAPPLSSGMRVAIKDNNGQRVYQVIRDDNGLLDLIDPKQTGVRADTPMYWTIEQGAENANRWSRTNHWYHKDIMFFAHENYQPIQAIRPIIEFHKNLRLVDHGFNGLPDVNARWDDPTDTPYSMIGQMDVGLMAITGGVRGIDFPPVGQSGLQTIRILVNRNSQANAEKKILTGQVQTNSMEWDGVSAVDADFSNWDTPNDEYWEYGMRLLSLEDAATVPMPERYDSVALIEEAQSWWFDGTNWVTQQWNDGGEPLFELFDTQGRMLTTLQDTTFRGSKIFAYKRGTIADKVLGIDVSRNKNGSLEFTNHINTDLITYQGGTVRGLKFYDLIEDGQDTIHSAWQPAGRSYQEQNADGFYAIPFNLQANPLNQEITTISSNEWNNHFKVIREGNDWFSGSEQFNLSLGRSILQHRSSLLKTMLLCSNSAIDLQKSIIYSEREYLRFRNKFDQALVNWANSNSIVDPQSTVLQLLTLLKTAKTPDFPFANNGIIGDYYIPATGAYLGLSALWAPEIFVENGTVMLRGHDGSLTRGTSVFDATTSQIVYSGRDTVTLALEQMIYDSANSQFKNNRPIFDLVQFTSGKFRSRDYSREEFNQVARPMFERWAAQNGYNYRKNEMYLADDPFTWNYATIRDVDGQDLPGYWRGIYRHYFDTDRPHTHPWEMFGYTNKPSFWDALYSWTDSAKRSSLIAAMESGKADPNGEADPVYARADVAKFIPVDEQGVLLNPVAAGIVIDTGLQKYSNEWVFGDGSPIEMMFWNSFSASFTIPHLSYLMKPARFIESNWVAGDEMFAFEQWFSNKSRNRAADQKSLVHNEMTGTTATRVLGVQVWISDYLRSQGQNITTAFGSKVRSLGANIAHKLGGFVDQSSVKAFTENSGLIPQEDVNIALYRSPSIREEFYGGVIVEWMGSGWRVLGYDVVNPVFKINPIKETGNKIKIKIGDDGPSSVDWHVDTYYTAGVLVHNNGTNYRCVTTHTSGRKFEQNFWIPETTGKFSPASSLIWHKEHEDFTDTVPYGTVFASRQDVADFLSGYQKFLENNGWVFDYYDNEANVIKDFRYSAQEYLYWTQSKWEPGTFIALSPAATSLKFTTDHGTVQNVEQLVHGVYSLLDRQGTAVPSSTVTVNRLDDEITIGVTQGGIFGSRVFVSEVEQALIFNNKTIFSDVIYDQLFNLRQNRIRLLALLSTEWKGRLDAPGFVITDNRLVPSFERQAEDIRYMYDIEKTINLPLRDNARHQVGYQNRSYLENLMYNDVNQFEFYQGMIQQKGAPGVFKRLMRNSELTQTRSLSFLEEWAFRKGQYGGVESRSTFEFEFNKELVLQDPQLVVAKNESLWDYFVYDVHPYGMSTPDEMAGRDSKEDTVISLYKSDDGTDSRWIVPPTGNLFEIQEVYTREKGWLPTAGYVRTSDAKWMALDLNALNTVVADSITDIALNDRVWVYKDHKGSWDIYRAVNYSTVDNEIAKFEAQLDGTVVTFDHPTTFKVGEVMYVEKAMQVDSEELVGAHVIDWVSDDFTAVRVGVDTLNVKVYAEDEERARAYKLESTRRRYDVDTIMNRSIITTTMLTAPQIAYLGVDTLQEGELLYVDVCYEYAFQNKMPDFHRRWSVFQKTNGQFVRVRTQPELIRRDRIVDVKIFENRSIRTDRVLNAKPLRYGDIVSFAPVQGLIVGQASKELFYKLPYDPAFYNEGAQQNVGMQWGANQVGRLWWDLDSVRFLISETSDIMDDTEKLYRTSNWGKLAPNTSVDVYEWTRSELTPAEWQAAYENGTDPNTYDGSVMNPDEPSWVEAQEWNAQLGRFVTFYYFWVKNRKKTPVGNDERSISAFEVARMIENPTTAGLAWVAPMDENSFIIAGVDQFLSSHSSLQFTLARNDAETPMHVEWDLLREGDERSLPTQGLWNKFITSLTGRNALGNVIPDPERYYTDRIGFDVEHGQNIFRNLQVARKRAVQHLNEIFARTPMVETRRGLDILNGSDGKTPALHWTQSDESYFVEPLPAKTFWNEKFNDEDNLNDLSPDLVYLLKDKDQFWSVMKRDAHGLATTINLYDHVVANMAELKALEQALQSGSSTVELEVGQYVKVDDDVNVETGGFWTVWKIQAGFVFELVAHQRYDSQDIWSYVDWYEAGYESVNPPRFVFQTATDRNNALLTNPYIKFAKVNDDGRGRWMWTELRDGVWQIVAKQLGTLQISDSVWANTGALLEDTFDTAGTTTATFDAKAFAAMVVNRDMGYEFNKVLNSLREGVLTDLETNEMFFGWVHYAHTEQDFIDWCFKTSFMYVTGYSDRLRQDPIAFADLTGNLLSYINEVKPYHVKVRDFISKYGVDTELANVMALDFDKPAYYDVALGKNRILDARVPGDVAIMQSGMWKHWYNQYAFNNNVKVRKLNVTLAPLDVANIHVGETINMKIYRQDGPPVHGDYGWDVISYDGIAAYDWDETITTKDYLTRYFDPEQYGLATMDMFDWDETAGMPRVIARRINQVEDTNDTITMDVYKDVNHVIDPAIELDIVSDNRAGKWVVTAPATSNYNDIGEPSVPNGPCDVTPI